MRATERARFIADTGLADCTCMALAADASTRRYFRLAGSSPAQLLMDVEPHSPDLPVFVQVSHYLNSIGLSAPRVLCSNQTSGLSLIEDFGTQTYTNLLNSGADETALYALAVDVLIRLHSVSVTEKAAVPVLPHYDLPALMSEVKLFSDWYAPNAGWLEDGDGFSGAFQQLWQQALCNVAHSTDTLVLRDFHVDNLMIISGRSGVAACGLLDFQDALIGSCAYDLVSLCQDARRDLSDGLEDVLIQRYLSAMPQLDSERFLAEYWLLAAQRHTKVAGIFQRLSQRDGKHQYLVHQPRVQRLLQRALQRAGLQAISELLEKNIAGWARPAHAGLQSTLSEI